MFYNYGTVSIKKFWGPNYDLNTYHAEICSGQVHIRTYTYLTLKMVIQTQNEI